MMDEGHTPSLPLPRPGANDGLGPAVYPFVGITNSAVDDHQDRKYTDSYAKASVGPRPLQSQDIYLDTPLTMPGDRHSIVTDCHISGRPPTFHEVADFDSFHQFPISATSGYTSRLDASPIDSSLTTGPSIPLQASPESALPYQVRYVQTLQPSTFTLAHSSSFFHIQAPVETGHPRPPVNGWNGPSSNDLDYSHFNPTHTWESSIGGDPQVARFPGIHQSPKQFIATRAVPTSSSLLHHHRAVVKVDPDLCLVSSSEESFCATSYIPASYPNLHSEKVEQIGQSDRTFVPQAPGK